MTASVDDERRLGHTLVAALALLVTPARADRRWRSTTVVLALVAVVWLVWGVLLVVLARAGLEPSGPLVLPVARARYYLVEALLVGPVFFLSSTAAAMASHRVLMRSRAALTVPVDERAWRAAVVAALAAATLSTLVLPDLVLFLVVGADALGPAIRVLAPLAGAHMIARVAWEARRQGQVRLSRALAAALVAVFVHLAISAPVLR